MTVCYNYRCRLSAFNDVYMFASIIVAHGLHTCRLDEAQWKGRLRLSFMFKIVIT